MKKHWHGWTFGSILATAGSIAAIIIAWPQINALLHYTVGMTDVIDNVKAIKSAQEDDRNYMKIEFDTVNSNIIRINWRLSNIERHYEAPRQEGTLSYLGQTTNKINQ